MVGLARGKIVYEHEIIMAHREPILSEEIHNNCLMVLLWYSMIWKEKHTHLTTKYINNRVAPSG